MDRILYSFQEADRQIAFLKLAEDRCEQCMRQIRRASQSVQQAGTGRVIDKISQNILEQERNMRDLIERIARLRGALVKTRALFEETEQHIIGQTTASTLAATAAPAAEALRYDQCLVGESRFSNVIYPDWVSLLAREYFARMA